jgi:hypothetical protein
MKKIAVGKQTGGFMKTRIGTRPLRVDTMLDRDSSTPDSHKELWVETPPEESAATDAFAEALAGTEGEEFGGEPERRIDPILGRIAKEGQIDVKKHRKKLEAIRRRIGVKEPPAHDDEWLYES